MASIDYPRFVRILSRCQELAADASQPAIIGHIYKETAGVLVSEFLGLDKAFTTASTAFAKENREALEALAELDGPYRVVRSSVLAVLPDTVLKDTLKALPTDTDKLLAIEGLLDVIDDHAGKPWADVLLGGEFGQKAPQTVKELHEAIAASKDLGKATTARATAFGPTYDVYLRFKRVVRDVLGPASKEYRRIHLRASPGATEEEEPKVEEPIKADAAPADPAIPPATPVSPPAGDKTPA